MKSTLPVNADGEFGYNRHMGRSESESASRRTELDAHSELAVSLAGVTPELDALCLRASAWIAEHLSATACLFVADYEPPHRLRCRALSSPAGSAEEPSEAPAHADEGSSARAMGASLGGELASRAERRKSTPWEPLDAEMWVDWVGEAVARDVPAREDRVEVASEPLTLGDALVGVLVLVRPSSAIRGTGSEARVHALDAGLLATLALALAAACENEAARHYAERLERSERSARDAMMIVAHDLKTPFRGAGFALEFALEDHEFSSEARAEIEAAVRLMHQGIRMVDGLARYVEEGARERQPVPLDPLVRRIISELASGEAGAGAQERIVVHGELPVVMGSSRGFEVVFRNLLGNALKHGGEDGPIDLHWEDAKRPVFLISDRGPGIPRSDRERVFEPFRRLASTGEPAAASEGLGLGLGLGLAIVKRLVERSGGCIELLGRDGGGTTVRFELGLGA